MNGHPSVRLRSFLATGKETPDEGLKVRSGEEVIARNVFTTKQSIQISSMFLDRHTCLPAGRALSTRFAMTGMDSVSRHGGLATYGMTKTD